MAEEKEYESGYEFWRDLSVRFGDKEAYRMLFSYLVIPLNGVSDVEAEDRFCAEACAAAGLPAQRRPRARK
jgi:hypothetical protein